MNDAAVLQIALQAMLAAARISAPILLTALAIGLVVGLLQTVTQLQEATLTFVPKFVACGLVLLLSGSWMLRELTGFTQELFSMVPSLVGG
jgi:flagellar biosynthesis protein FliQ